MSFGSLETTNLLPNHGSIPIIVTNGLQVGEKIQNGSISPTQKVSGYFLMLGVSFGLPSGKPI